MGRRIGFTLTEILIVLIIIGVLATLGLPMLVKTMEKAKVGEAISNLNLIRTGQKIYFLEYSTFLPGITSPTSNLSDLNIEDPNAPSSRYFNYTIQSSGSSDFTAQAQRRSDAPHPYGTYYYRIYKNGTITSHPAGNPF